MHPEPLTPLRFSRLLLTGAAGNLGRELRPRLARYCAALRLSHRSAMGEAGAGEEIVIADLADKAAVHAMVAGVDAIVHLGGVSTEQPWDPILAGNIVGMVNLYEAARRHGVKRIVFASSNHVTGFYRQDEVITTRDPVKPDGFYGLSKAFGENLAQLYWDRYGLETVSLRIGSLVGVNYLGRPATTILAGGGGEVLVSVVELDDAVGGLLSGFAGEPSEPCLNQSSGSGGQVTDPAGAAHRPALWAGDLSTACASWLSLWPARSWACLPGAPV